MLIYSTFKNLMEAGHCEEAEELLCKEYAMSPYMAYTFCAGVAQTNWETVAYSFGQLDQVALENHYGVSLEQVC